VSDLLNTSTPIQARHIHPGQGQAVEVNAGQLLQIQTLQGKQVADFVAFSRDDPSEYLSTAATRSTNANIVPRLEMTLYSNRRQPMFEIVADTVGRHDMLFACCDPVRYEMLGAPPGHANCHEALAEALGDYGIGYDRIPAPINWFMNVAILQRGDLEIREPLAEPEDYVLLRALKDVVAAVSACPQEFGATNAGNPSDLMIRVYSGEPPTVPQEESGVAAAAPGAAPATTGAAAETAEGAASEGIDRRAARGAARRAERQEAAATAAAPTETAAQAAPAAPEQREGPVPPAQRGRPARPARLRDTAEATVTRVEQAPANGRD
jgi:uncharacterized protein YcgI (DUF1989 family)